MPALTHFEAVSASAGAGTDMPVQISARLCRYLHLRTIDLRIENEGGELKLGVDEGSVR